MNNKEIILSQLNCKPTEIQPYDVSFEPKLYKKLTEFYGDEKWEEKKLRKFLKCCFGVDTMMSTPVPNVVNDKAHYLNSLHPGIEKYNDNIYGIDAYGSIWRNDRNIMHQEVPALTEPTFENYRFPDAEMFIKNVDHGKADALKFCRDEKDSFITIYIGWGIFERTWCMRGFENAMMDMLTEEKFYTELCEKITDLYIEFIRYVADVNADAILLGDDWGDQRGVIMGKDLWLKYFKPCYERIYDEIHKQDKKIIQHCCGSIVDIYDDLAEIGMDCHESVQPESANMAPELVKAGWGYKICFLGCLGSQSTLFTGTPDGIRTEILRLRDLFKPDGGYILAPAKSLSDEMDIEQAVAVIETLSTLND